MNLCWFLKFSFFFNDKCFNCELKNVTKFKKFQISYQLLVVRGWVWACVGVSLSGCVVMWMCGCVGMWMCGCGCVSGNNCVKGKKWNTFYSQRHKQVVSIKKHWKRPIFCRLINRKSLFQGKIQLSVNVTRFWARN